MWLQGFGLVSFALIIFISFLPLGDKRAIHTKGPLHAPGHIVAFATATALVSLSMSSRRKQLMLVAATMGLGVLIELGEHIFKRTRTEFGDMGWDFIGVLIGFSIAMTIEKHLGMDS